MDLAEFFRPRTIEDAVAIAGRGGVRPMAGCTDLYPATDRPALSGPMLDLTAVEGLGGIARAGAGWRIGAVTRWAEVARADLPPAFDGLKAAAREVGAVQIQNSGTLGGNLCNASPAADGVPPLMTLDARVELVSNAGRRELPLAEFITGPRQVALRSGELLSAVIVPEPVGRGAFLKLGARGSLVISIVMVAARLVIREGRVAEAALTVGACSPVAVRLKAQEAALLGLPAAEAAGAIEAGLVVPALSPLSDVRARADYRQEAAVTLLRRAVAGLAEAGR
jgi:CO/xanthine dehydrogenase FAD-binding subunit